MSLSHLWMDHRPSRNMKLRLCNMCVCTTLTHACEEWNLTKAVWWILNGFNSRCLHVITGEEDCDTAISRAYNMLLAVQHRRLRYLWHLLRLPRVSVVRRTLLAMRMETTRTAIRKGAYSWTARVQNWKTMIPWQWTALHGGTKWRHLCFDTKVWCDEHYLPWGWRQPEQLSGREHIHGLPGFRTERPWYPGSGPHCMAAQSGDTCVLMLHCIIGPTGSIMNMMMMMDNTFLYKKGPAKCSLNLFVCHSTVTRFSP